MADSEIILFPDSNFFLECRVPDECPWAEITDAETITLAVCRTVREEIDRLKSAGRGRISKKARDWVGKFRNASRENRKIELRATNPKIILWLTSPVPRASQSDILDPNRPDDRAIMDILDQQKANPHLADAVFFTDDGGAADTARHVGLNVIDIPLDEDESSPHWRLPREPDEAEKKIRALEKHIAVLESQSPSIIIDAIDQDGNKAHKLPHSLVHFPALLDGQIDALLEQAQKLHPKQTVFEKTKSGSKLHAAAAGELLGAAYSISQIMNVHGQWEAPSEKAIQTYLEEYPEWVDRTRTFFTCINENLEAPSRIMRITIALDNIGSVPANNTILTIEALGAVSLSRKPKSKGKDGRWSIAFPSPPKAPQGKYKDPFNIPNVASLFENRFSPPMHSFLDSLDVNRDREEFYWRDQEDHKCLVLDCEEFRHQEKVKKVSFLAIIPKGIPLNSCGAIKCTLSATNLPQPAQKTFPLSISMLDGDTESYAVEFLHKNLHLEFLLGQVSLPRMPQDIPAEVRSRDVNEDWS